MLPRTLLAASLAAGLTLALPARADFLFGKLVPDPPALEANGDSGAVDISRDGLTVVFSSAATNWVPGSDTTTKVVALDYDVGVYEIVSRTTAGIIVRGERPAVSADGRYVAFLNFGGALGVGVPTSGWQVVRKDRQTGELRLASANAAGEAATSFVDEEAVGISANGRYIAFEASSPNLGFATGGTTQIFVKDMDNGTVALASVTPGGTAAPGECFLAPHALSADGRFVAFICGAALLPGATSVQAYVRDLQTNTTELVSRANGVNGAPSSTFANYVAMSPSARFVAFQNPAFGGLGGVPAVHSGVYVRDRVTATTTSIPTPAGADVGNCTTSAVSDIGTVLMQCRAATVAQVYLHVPGDPQSPFLISRNWPGSTAGDQPSGGSVATDASGLSMAFDSQATNLIEGDSGEHADIFVLVDDAIVFGIFADGFEG